MRPVGMTVESGADPWPQARDRTKGARAWHPATRLVHEGTLRSQFGETSEAIFLNSGYIYASAEQAEARFKGDEDGYVYSRYANPTVSMFETRMCALEGATPRAARRAAWPPSPPRCSAI